MGKTRSSWSEPTDDVVNQVVRDNPNGLSAKEVAPYFGTTYTNLLNFEKTIFKKIRRKMNAFGYTE